MAHLDFQEQEQIDQLKAFWNRYGNFIVFVLLAALGTLAAWNLWENHLHKQSLQAGALYEELDKAASGNDLSKAEQVFNDLKERYGNTLSAQQGALLLARKQFQSAKPAEARATLTWLIDKAKFKEYQALARLRLAAILMDEKKYDEVLTSLEKVPAPEFEALMADRRGDALLALGKQSEAEAAYMQAWKAMDAKIEYRQMIGGKLASLGVAVDLTPSLPGTTP